MRRGLAMMMRMDPGRVRRSRPVHRADVHAGKLQECRSKPEAPDGGQQAKQNRTSHVYKYECCQGGSQCREPYMESEIRLLPVPNSPFPQSLWLCSYCRCACAFSSAVRLSAFLALSITR